MADVMTRKRFELLARHIHFVDNNDFSLTDAKKKENKAWKIRPCISALQRNLKKHFATPKTMCG